MHTQIRGFNVRGTTPGRGPAREARVRRIRGYDDHGALLFTSTACTSPREGSRQALDQREVRAKRERFGAKLVRVEIDAIAGGHSEFRVRGDGSLTQVYRTAGESLSFSN